MGKTWLNYHHLYYFRTIALEGSVVKAAKKLRLGQPTISTQLAIFEETIGQKLFERKGRSLELTEVGRMVLDYADEIFKLGDEMLEAINDRLHSDRVDLTIGSLDSVPKQILSDLTMCAQRFANCRISLLEGTYDELMVQTKAHRIDLLVANREPDHGQGSGVRARHVGTTPVVICGDKMYESLAQDFPASLSGKPFILPTLHSRLRNDIDQWLKAHQIAVDAVLETQDISLQKLLVTQKLGLAPLAETEAQDLVMGQKAVTIGVLDGINESIWLALGERRSKSSGGPSVLLLWTGG